MPRRFLFTRGRQVLLLYLCSSIIATLTFFRIFRGLILKNQIESDKNIQKPKVPVPEVAFNKTFEHGVLQSFTKKPIITKMECEGSSAYERICKFTNLCYSPNSNRFFALSVDKNGLMKSWKLPEDNRLLDLTTVDDHNIFYFEFEEDPEYALRELAKSDMFYMLVSKKTYVFSRFVYNNIMHNLHDDFMGQYILHKKYSFSSNDTKIIDTDNFIFFTDGLIENPNDHLFATLSRHPFMYREYLKNTKSSSPPICFANAIVGNSKEGIWYDYGFYDEPQGPISKKVIVGKHAQEVANFLRSYYDLSLPDTSEINKLLKGLSLRKRIDMHKISKNYYISIFSRTLDRLILNEKDLMTYLENMLGLPVRLVQLEVLKFNEIIEIMTNTIISIGLHGSALIFAMFMPKSSILIEMFPYAIPGENYSPYRTLALLPELEMNYKMWINTNVTMNYSQLGIRKKLENLTPEEFINIISLKTVPPHVCCGNLPWMVRIYQDTVVNIIEIQKLIKDAVRENIRRLSNPKKIVSEKTKLLEISRHRVKSVDYRILEQKSFTGLDKIKMFQLIINWENPWKEIDRTPTGYGVWIEEMMEEVKSTEPKIIFEACAKGSDFNIWIRPYIFDKGLKQNQPAAGYSRKFTIKCE
jgi:protein O-mannose beta-1,4-N-acetylglucosaminyltransferase